MEIRFVVTETNRLYGWGRGSVVGRADNTSHQMTPVLLLDHDDAGIVNIECGGSQATCIYTIGDGSRLYAIGVTDNYIVGTPSVGPSSVFLTPTVVRDVSGGHTIRHLVVGSTSSMFTLEELPVTLGNMEIYSAGKNTNFLTARDSSVVTQVFEVYEVIYMSNLLMHQRDMRTLRLMRGGEEASWMIFEDGTVFGVGVSWVTTTSVDEYAFEDVSQTFYMHESLTRGESHVVDISCEAVVRNEITGRQWAYTWGSANAFCVGRTMGDSWIRPQPIGQGEIEALEDIVYLATAYRGMLVATNRGCLYAGETIAVRIMFLLMLFPSDRFVRPLYESCRLRSLFLIFRDVFGSIP